MMNGFFKINLLVLFLMPAVLKAAETLESNAVKTCVASMIVEDKVNSEIKRDAQKILQKMGYDRKEKRFDYFVGSPEVLVRCLEGNYEDVIILVHSAEIYKNHYSLVYRENAQAQLKVLNARIFSRLKYSPTLRQISLVTCETEKVLLEYKVITRIAKEKGINLRILPESVIEPSFTNKIVLKIAQWWYGKNLIDLKVRDQRLTSYLLAESSQDSEAKNVHCLLRTNGNGRQNIGNSSCLRNHYYIGVKTNVNKDLGRSTYFINFSMDEMKISKVGGGVLNPTRDIYNIESAQFLESSIGRN